MVRALPTILLIEGAVRPRPRATTIFCQPQARAVSFESAQELQVVSEKKPSHMTAERIQELDRVEFKWKRYSGPFGGEKSLVLI